MYHLLVTAEDDVWKERPYYSYPQSRFLEYTDDEIVKAFRILTSQHIDTLLSWPCLFAYEGRIGDVYLGKLTSIEKRTGSRSLVIRYELDNQVPPIPFERVEPLCDALDIRDWEMNRTHWAIKNVDLFEWLRSSGIIPAAQDLGADGETQPSNDLPLAAESGLQASSLQEFIGIVLQQDAGGSEIFYRGHSNQSYKLEPSVFRRDRQGNYLHRDAEDVIYRELLVSNSIDFHGDNYTLDRLVRMQHFSLPTRLLDITSNPLIALYFACKSHSAPDAKAEEVPGEVIVFSVASGKMKYFDSDTVSCIANLARLSKRDRDLLDCEVEDIDKFNGQEPMKRLLHFVKEEKSFFEPRIEQSDLSSIVCVKGKRSNSRISSQSGAFLLFGHEAVLDEQGSSEILVQRITVTNKAEILKQLDRMNINESTVFPYIENSARYVAEKFRFRPEAITNAESEKQ